MIREDTSQETATYAQQVLMFELPIQLSQEPVELRSHNYSQVLAQVALPGVLANFLAYAFEVEALALCGVQGNVIRIGVSSHQPGGIGYVFKNQRADLVWQALTIFTGQPDLPEPPWRTMPYAYYVRGEGIDMGATGVHMARMMNAICGVSTS